jgi:hypothetical protein
MNPADRNASLQPPAQASSTKLTNSPLRGGTFRRISVVDLLFFQPDKGNATVLQLGTLPAM